jgi:hypothetical protein
MESAIVPVMSSVTVACTVRSPSASGASSSSKRRMACWLRSVSLRCASDKASRWPMSVSTAFTRWNMSMQGMAATSASAPATT